MDLNMERLSGNIDAGIHIGVQGKPGPQGEDGGYYIPSAKQESKNELILEFSPTSAKMAFVEPVKIRLPEGEAGEPFTYDDFTPAQLEALKGANGFSPIVQVFPKAEVIRYPDGTMVTKEIGYTIRITDSEGYQDIDILHGDKGEKGEDGTMTFEDLTDAQRESLRGEPGKKGDTGDSGVYILSEGETLEDAPEDVDVVYDPFFDTEVIPGGGIDVEGAVPGQTIAVKSVDANGKPTEWEAVDFPEGGSGGAQSDWNAAEGEPGHVLNRPFYSEYETKTLLEETTLTVSEEAEGVALIPHAVDLTGVPEVEVTYNGTKYVCPVMEEVIMNDDVEEGVTWNFGNLAAMDGGESTGEPFIAQFFDDRLVVLAGAYGVIAPLDGSTEFTVSITDVVETVHPVPEKYLPTNNYEIAVDDSEGIDSTAYGRLFKLEAYDTAKLYEVLKNRGTVWLRVAKVDSHGNLLYRYTQLVSHYSIYPFPIETYKESASAHGIELDLSSLQLDLFGYDPCNDVRYAVKVNPL